MEQLGRMKLLEVGEDFDIKIRSYSGNPKHKYNRYLHVRSEKIRISFKKMKQLVESLNKRYPGKNYFVEKRRIQKKRFWVFGRREDPDPKRPEKKRRDVPIYYWPKKKKLYVPTSHVGRSRRLVSSVLLYRLRDLGVRYSLDYRS